MSGGKANVKQERVCAWPGCGVSSSSDLSPWDYLPDDEYNHVLAREWLHDPATGKDYCRAHWHYKPGVPTYLGIREPGPEEES